eukprot:gene21205-11869_t
MPPRAPITGRAVLRVVLAAACAEAAGAVARHGKRPRLSAPGVTGNVSRDLVRRAAV